MAISEIVRLTIELEGNQAAGRSLRSLGTNTDRLKAQALGVAESFAQMQQRVRGELSRLDQFVAQTATNLRESLSKGLILPEGLARQVDAEAEKLKKVEEDARRERRKGRQESEGEVDTQAELNEVRKRGNLLLIDFARLAQDGAYGVRAMINNLDPLIVNSEKYTEAVGRMNAKTGQQAGLFRTLFSQLGSATGVLLLVNMAFAIGQLTGLWDKLAQQISDTFKTVDDADKRIRELKKSVDETVPSAIKLGQGLDMSEVVDAFEAVNTQIDNIKEGKLERFFRILGKGLGDVGGGGNIRASQELDKRAKAVDDHVKLLDGLSKSYQDVVKKFDVEIQILKIGDPNVISQRQQEIVDRIGQVNADIAEAQRRRGEESVSVEQAILRRQADLRIEALRKERQDLLNFHKGLKDQEVQFRKDRAAAVESGDRDAIQRTTNALRSLIQLQDRVARLSNSIFDLMNATRLQATQDAATVAQDAAREAERMIEDLTNQAEQNNLRATRQGVSERIALLRQEAAERKQQLENQLEDYERVHGPNGEMKEATEKAVQSIDRLLRSDLAETFKDAAEIGSRRITDMTAAIDRNRAQVQLEGAQERARIREIEIRTEQEQQQNMLADYEKQYGKNGVLSQLVADYVKSLGDLLIEDKRKIFREDAQAERDHNEALRQAEEDRLISLGADEATILKARLERLDVEARIDLDDIERQRQIAAERQALITQITQSERKLAEERRDQNRDLYQQAVDYAKDISDEAENLQLEKATDRGAIVILNDRLERLRAELQLTGQEAAKFTDTQAELDRVSAQLAKTTDAESDEAKALVAQRDALVEKLREYGLAQERVYEILKLIGGTNEEIADKEDSILDRREKRIQQFTQRVIAAVVNASRVQRRYTDLDVEYERFQQKKRLDDLERSLREGQITREEYNLQRRKLAQDTADFERDVERDNSRVVRSLISGVTDAIISELEKRAAAFIANQIAMLISSQASTAAAAASSTAAATEIAAAAAPAAATMSIATLGGAAAAGAAAAVAAIGLIYAAVKGFDEGGYTGRKGSKEVAGVVHGDEFVFTSKAVRGNPAPFYALMKALEQGAVNPESLFGFLSGAGYKVAARNIMYTAGIGFEQGGYVEAGKALFNIPGSATQEVPVVDVTPLAEENELMRRDIRQLMYEVGNLARTPIDVRMGRRAQTQVTRGGQSYANSREVVNPFVRRK